MHYLYLAVVAAVALGIAVGLAAPDAAVELKPLGTAFVNLIKMMISPVIFVTIVLGIGSVARAAKVGRVGLITIGYFMVMSTFALAIGLAVGNLLHPGAGLHLDPSSTATAHKQAEGAEGTTDFLLGIVPDTLLSALTGGEVLQTLLVALLTGFGLQQLGAAGAPILRGIEHVQRLVFRILAMIMWAAPVGAFGAIAAVVGETGWSALRSLGVIMLGFYLTCALFVFVVLGAVLWFGARMNILRLLRYLAREFLLILSTSSSETALPRLIAKMEHLGVSRPVVGITVPTGYSFNLDGTSIYLTMATLFIASAQDSPLPVSAQIPLLLFMIVASKGAAGVSGAGLATLAAWAPVAPPGAGRRGRVHRRHRPVHVRGPRADQLRGQRRRHRADRPLDRRVRRRPVAPGALRRGPVQRGHPAGRPAARRRRNCRHRPDPHGPGRACHRPGRARLGRTGPGQGERMTACPDGARPARRARVRRTPSGTG